MIDDACLQKLVDEAKTQDKKEDDEYRKQAIVQFREWIEKSQEIKNCRTDDAFLLVFLRDRNFSLLDAQHFLLTFFKLREMFPQLFRNLDVEIPAIRRVFSSGVIFVCPHKNEKGRRVHVVNVAKVDPHDYTFHDLFKATVLSVQTISEDESHQLLGSVLIVDMTGVSVAHVAMCPLFEMSTFVRLSRSMLPKSLKEAHIINMPSAVKGFVKFCMSGLSEKMKNKFFFHNSLNELHNSVSASILPLELGGTVSTETIIDLWIKEVESKRDIILAIENTTYLGPNEHITQESIFGGAQGSFRQMNID